MKTATVTAIMAVLLALPLIFMRCTVRFYHIRGKDDSKVEEDLRYDTQDLFG